MLLATSKKGEMLYNFAHFNDSFYFNKQFTMSSYEMPERTYRYRRLDEDLVSCFISILR